MDIVFLTRSGCVNSPVMQERLLAAIETLDFKTHLEIIDVGTLPSDDLRTGYGTPTTLVEGMDLFGNPVPKAAPPI